MAKQNEDSSPPDVKFIRGVPADGRNINAGRTGKRPKALEMKQRPATPPPPPKKKDQ